MAVGRYIAHRKLADGSYEDVYTKSESGLIYRPNGRTVEQDLAAYLPEYQNSDDVPKSLLNGKCVVTNSGVYFGFNGFVVELRTGVSDPSAEFTSKEVNIVNNEIIETGDNYTLITTFPSSSVVSQSLTYNGKTYTKNTLLEDNKITEVVS